MSKIKFQTIRCIIKDDGLDPHERIQYVGGINPDGSYWKRTQQEVIREIDSRKWIYECCAPDGLRTEVIAVTGHSGHRFLKTALDKDVPDNLLKLPACP